MDETYHEDLSLMEMEQYYVEIEDHIERINKLLLEDYYNSIEKCLT